MPSAHLNTPFRLQSRISACRHYSSLEGIYTETDFRPSRIPQGCAWLSRCGL